LGAERSCHRPTWILAAVLLPLILYCVGQAAARRQPPARSLLSGEWFSLTEAPGHPVVLNGGLLLPSGTLLEIGRGKPLPEKVSWRLSGSWSYEKPFELGVTTSEITSTCPVGTPDSREERTPDGKLTIEFRANGRTLEYRVNDMTRMTWDYAPRRITKMFLYTQWSDLRIDGMQLSDLTDPQAPRPLVELSFTGPSRTARPAPWLVAVLLTMSLLIAEWLLGGWLEVSRRKVVVSWLLITLPVAAALAAPADQPVRAALTFPLVGVWLLLRLRFWILQTKLLLVHTRRAWRLAAALAGLAALLSLPPSIWRNAESNGAAVSLVFWLILSAGGCLIGRGMRMSPVKILYLFGPFLGLFVPALSLFYLHDAATGAWLTVLGVLALTIPLSHLRDQLAGYGAAMLAVALLLFLSVEGALRVSEPGKRLQGDQIGGNFQTDDVLFWVPKGFFGYEDSFPYRQNMSIKTIRFRGNEDAPPEKPTGVKRILTLGGSNVWGDGQPTAATAWPALLENDLRGRGLDVEVLNAGVRGFDSFQIMVLFTRYAVRYQPDLVVVYLGFNDSGATYGLSTLRELYLAGHEKTPVRRLQRFFHRSLLYNALTRAVLALRRPLEDTAGSGPLHETNPVSDFKANLRDIVAAARAAGAPTVLATEFYGINFRREEKPGRALDLRRATAQVAEETGAPFLDAYGYFAALDDPLAFVWPHDPVHFNSEGHARLARLLADFIVEKGLLETGAQ